MKISACLVTRGDVDMTQILDTLPYDDIVLWNNADRADLGIYGRYAAIEHAKHDVIYTQDDDVLVTCHRELEREYRDGWLTCNYPPPWDIPWVARGALFHRDMPAKAFHRYFHPKTVSGPMWDRFFTHYVCDAVFALMTDNVHVVDLGSEDLPWGFDEGRVSTSWGWYDGYRPKVVELCNWVKEMERAVRTPEG